MIVFEFCRLSEICQSVARKQLMATSGKTVTYGVLYYGVRPLQPVMDWSICRGDVDGDGVVSGETDFSALDAGGEIERVRSVSLYSGNGGYDHTGALYDGASVYTIE